MIEKMSLADALLLAVARETLSHEFYTSLANHFKNKEVAAKIRSLAEMELFHRQEAIKLFKIKTGTDPDTSKVEIQPYPLIPKDNANIYEILEFAAVKEKAAYEFYRELAKKAEDDKTRRMFIRFSDEELQHCELLNAEASALRGQMSGEDIHQSSGMEY